MNQLDEDCYSYSEAGISDCDEWILKDLIPESAVDGVSALIDFSEAAKNVWDFAQKLIDVDKSDADRLCKMNKYQVNKAKIYCFHNKKKILRGVYFTLKQYFWLAK